MTDKNKTPPGGIRLDMKAGCEVLPDTFVLPLSRQEDHRGTLTECFRDDSEIFKQHHVRQAYISLTKEGTIRGPHEHKKQSDLFIFVGPGNFFVYLWQPIRSTMSVVPDVIVYAGVSYPSAILIPPGIIHAYKALDDMALSINMPDYLYAGYKRKHPVDEIRWEDTDTFKIPSDPWSMSNAQAIKFTIEKHVNGLR